MTGSGAAVGGAAVPGMGTGAALALSAGETVGFLEASTLFVRAAAEIDGVRVEDLDRRSGLALTLLLGASGANRVEKTAQRTGRYWGRLSMASRADGARRSRGRHSRTVPSNDRAMEAMSQPRP